MFLELEQAYNNSIGAGIKPSRYSWIPSWLRSKPLDREGKVASLPDNLRRFAPRSALSKMLSDKEFMQYVNNIPTVIAREIDLRDTYDLRPKPEGWRTTDPRHHDPNNFRYLVHCYSDDGAIADQLRLGNTQELNDFLSKMALSCSMLDELVTRPYKDDVIMHGFILDAPEDKIIAIDYADMGKSHRLRHDPGISEQDINKELAREIDLRRRTPQAQTFMRECHQGGVFYNEVVVNGGDDLKVVGVYLLTDPFLDKSLYEIYSRLTVEEMEQLQRLHGISLNDYSELSLYGEPLRGGMWETTRNIQGYVEAQDLARILDVPLVPIRNFIYDHRYL